MKNAIILHGMPSKEEYYSDEYPSASNSQWVPWLQKQLLIRDIPAVTPEMPISYLPDYEVWKREFERFDITPETILVGHSCGAGFLLRWLTENKDVHVGKVILVAPWLDPDKELANDFFNFQIDPTFPKRTLGTVVFDSTNDDVIKDSVERIMSVVPDIKVVEFHNYGHFCIEDMKTEAFPELLEECLK